MVAIVVTLLLYKKRVAAEKRAVLEHKAAEIRNRVASILSLGGICSQTDADGWQEYRCYDWGDVIKCYIKNIDDHNKVLVICPSFASTMPLAVTSMFLSSLEPSRVT